MNRDVTVETAQVLIVSVSADERAAVVAALRCDYGHLLDDGLLKVVVERPAAP